MKQLISLLFLFPLLANAQDWALFPYGQRSFYYNGDSTYLIELHQDSTELIGETQRLYFNQKAPDPDLQDCFDAFDEIDATYTEISELQWSGDSILFYENDLNEIPFFILLNKPIGTSWIISNDYTGAVWDEVLITYDSINTENVKWRWTSDYLGTQGYWMDTILSMEKYTDSIVVTFTREGVIDKKNYYREALEYCLQAPDNSIMYIPQSPFESTYINYANYTVGEIGYIAFVENYSPMIYSQERILISNYLQDTLSCYIDGPSEWGGGFTFDTFRGLTGEFYGSEFGVESTYLIGSIMGGIVWGDVSPVNIVHALPQNKLLIVAPNPASKEISINAVLEGNYNYHIYSINGQTLGSGKLKDNSINIESLNSGVFILELENEKEILRGRFIKL